MKLESKIIFPSLALGLSVFIMQASESIISVCFNSSLQQYGGDIAVGAMTILTSVMQFAMLPLQGLGQGAQPIISYNYGAKKCAEGERCLWTSFESEPLLRYVFVAAGYDRSPGICRNVHHGPGSFRFHQDGASYLSGCFVPFWNPACLPDDL